MTEPAPITVEQMYGPQLRTDDEIDAALDRSLDPVASTSLYDTVAELGVGPSSTVLDIGARDGRHGLALAGRLGCRVIGVEPVAANREDGAARIQDHPSGPLVELRPGVIEAIPVDDRSVDIVFGRDMITHVADLDVALAECVRVLAPGGALVVYMTVAGPRLEPMEAAELESGLAIAPGRLDGAAFEAAAADAGMIVESREIIGSQWRERWEEDGTSTTSTQLLHAARLLRGRDELIEELGEISYRIELANAYWGIYQMIGKLEPRVYVLRVPD